MYREDRNAMKTGWPRGKPNSQQWHTERPQRLFTVSYPPCTRPTAISPPPRAMPTLSQVSLTSVPGHASDRSQSCAAAWPARWTLPSAHREATLGGRSGGDGSASHSTGHSTHPGCTSDSVRKIPDEGGEEKERWRGINQDNRLSKSNFSKSFF